MQNENIENLVREINTFCAKNASNIARVEKEISSYKVIEMLEKIAVEMEQQIQKEHKRTFVTDDVEREFMQFACNCMEYILNEREKDKRFRALSGKLFSHRHFGYAFFVVKDKEYAANVQREDYKLQYQEKTELLEKYKNIYKTAYMSLAEFYNKFFGRFNDNECAIKLLCKYFISDILFDEEEQKKIIDGLIDHVKNAGDSSDFGYAFNGLEMINRYIGNLPIYIIDKLLNQYTCNEVEGRILSRKQIFAIISNSFPPDELQQYKFLYLDSIFIVEMLRDICNEERKGWGEAVINFYVEREMPINQKSITVEDDSGNKYELFIDSENAKRVLKKINGEVLFEVCIDKSSTEKKMIIVYRGRRHILENELELDSTLSAYNRQFFLNLKTELINSRENNYISYKLVYLNNYHGMKQQKFCFDKRFSYEEGTITYDDVDKTNLPLEYSSKIMSIHAIVGRNGTGKTSLVNFLGNDFVNIMFELEEQGATISSIINKNEKMQGTEFLVVFEMDEQLYYISSINIVQKPEKVKLYEPRKEGSIKRALSKVFYFSNKVDINEVFEPRIMKKGEAGKKLEVWGTKNYSEQRTLSQQINWQMDEIASRYETQDWEEKGGGFFNRDLFFQLLFLRDYFDDEGKILEAMLWDKFSVENLTLGDSEIDEIIQEFIKGQEKEIYGWQTIFNARRTLQHFSSGQYARFNFFAKLYWIVKGYSCNTEIINELGSQTKFYSDDVIGEEDSAILFIDEGDLYYHPEWQRQYIADLCKIIEESLPCKLQIIIATNSPFILSDIFEDNIIFLTEKENSISTYDKTFGQNIHTLLKKDFFMEYTIGEFAREKIVQIFGVLEEQQYVNKEELAVKVAEILKITVLPEQVYEQLYHFADSIGEDVYRKHILDLIEKHMKNNLDVRINYLKMRQKEIEEELQSLEREKGV